MRTDLLIHRGSHRIGIVAVITTVAAASACAPATTPHDLRGDWDAYVADGSTARPGFEGWRRMGFAHFAGADSGFAGIIRRRTGEPMVAVSNVATANDSVLLTGIDSRDALKGTWTGDTLTGILLNDGKPTGRRMRLVRRTTPFVAEQNYLLWPGVVSESQFAVTEDTAVFMTTRDGAKLVSYIARPAGNGPFGVVMQRTPYTRILRPAGRFLSTTNFMS